MHAKDTGAAKTAGKAPNAPERGVWGKGRVLNRVKKRYGLAIAPRTLTSWLTEHKPLTTYHRLRDQVSLSYKPHQLIRTTRLHHQQVYTYRLHQGKLNHILSTTEHHAYLPLADYLTEMVDSCPHRLFQDGGRASKGGQVFNIDAVEIREKDSLAPPITELVLQTVTHNRRRHDELQHFMIATDSVTVAVEVPIYLTPEDIAHMQHKLGFIIPLPAEEILTGHIDVLQIRNGRRPHPRLQTRRRKGEAHHAAHGLCTGALAPHRPPAL